MTCSLPPAGSPLLCLCMLGESFEHHGRRQDTAEGHNRGGSGTQLQVGALPTPVLSFLAPSCCILVEILDYARNSSAVLRGACFVCALYLFCNWSLRSTINSTYGVIKHKGYKQYPAQTLETPYNTTSTSVSMYQKYTTNIS
jgi:hypothetical protein